ncbi:hypothetical protein EZV62_002354 [Acer yangbiense]|uniref:Uncharacterized protein n=1 Tax=Acer yangbiense TaxID=1000413 RepID=A0A5C7IX13_9ROSI|nr:hypothetical protein EZV62_002354 [Acer yangbiense]
MLVVFCSLMNEHKTYSNSSDSSNSILSTKPSLICTLSSNQVGMTVRDDHLTQWNLLRSFYLRGDCDDVESGNGLIFQKLRFTDVNDVVMKDPKTVCNQFIKIVKNHNIKGVLEMDKEVEVVANVEKEGISGLEAEVEFTVRVFKSDTRVRIRISRMEWLRGSIDI